MYSAKEIGRMRACSTLGFARYQHTDLLQHFISFNFNGLDLFWRKKANIVCGGTDSEVGFSTETS